MSEKKEEIEEIVKKIKQQEEENDLFDFSFAQKDNSENVEQENQKKHNNDDLDKYIEEQLKNPEIIEFKKQTETEEWKEKKYPSFEKIMELKQQYKNITLVEMGDKLEEAIFQIKQSLYIIKPMPQTKYQNFIANVGAIAANITEFTKYSIAECVVFPELDETDLEEMPIGVGDILTNEIWRFSRFASTKKITRI